MLEDAIRIISVNVITLVIVMIAELVILFKSWNQELRSVILVEMTSKYISGC